ncbi:MAG TPA: alpha/beta hydrolase [Polyangiaceae bacterium]
MSKFKSMTRALGVSLAFVVASCVVGNPDASQKVPGNLAERNRTHTDLSYNPPGHSVATRKLDLYLPAGETPKPVIVWVHGGGWTVGDKTERDENGVQRGALKSILAQVPRGIAVASINYRLSGEATFPAPVQDVKLAVRWLKANAATYKLDPNKVILAGESAGGHLAALAAVSQDLFELSVAGWPNSSVAGVVDIVGPTDLNAFFQHSPYRFYAGHLLGCPVVNGAHQCTQADLQNASVTNYIDHRDPPVYMAYGDADPVVAHQAQGRLPAEQWALAKGKTLQESEVVLYDLVEGGQHDLAPQSSPDVEEEDRKTYNFAAMQQFLDAVAPR